MSCVNRMEVARMTELLNELWQAETAYLTVLERARQEVGADTIRDWRLQRGWSKMRMGRELGFGNSYIGKLEAGILPVSPQILRAMHLAEKRGL